MLQPGEQSYNNTSLTYQELEARLQASGNPLSTQKILSAYEMARSVHEFQTRNDGTPYFSHSARSAKIIMDELGIFDDDVIIAALLQDVLEDSDTITRGVLEYNFGSYVAYVVEMLTKDLRKAARNPEEVDIEFVARLKGASDDCLVIKLVARLDNIRCLSFNLKRNPLVYLGNTLERYVPLAEQRKNKHLEMLASAIRLEANKFLG
ncbi:MAG: HD domain-containing protein [Bradyrhizobiaceae bacterium]|nr:HD domain-containing protein [Bradyrhizobiaceae bacterium]